MLIHTTKLPTTTLTTPLGLKPILLGLIGITTQIIILTTIIMTTQTKLLLHSIGYIGITLPIITAGFLGALSIDKNTKTIHEAFTNSTIIGITQVIIPTTISLVTFQIWLIYLPIAIFVVSIFGGMTRYALRKFN